MAPGLTASEKAGLPPGQHQDPAQGSWAGAKRRPWGGAPGPCRLVTPTPHWLHRASRRKGEVRADIPAPRSKNVVGSPPHLSPQMDAAL